MAIYRYVIFDIPPLCLCCSLLLSITAHWQLAIHLGWPRNVHLSDYSPHPAPKSGQGRGGSGLVANGGNSQIKWRLDITTFRSVHFCKVHTKLQRQQSAASAVLPLLNPLTLRPWNFCSHKHNNFQCALNCSGKRVAGECEGEGAEPGQLGAIQEVPAREKGMSVCVCGGEYYTHLATCVYNFERVFKIENAALASGHKMNLLYSLKPSAPFPKYSHNTLARGIHNERL